jgi:hypothetical protein
MYRVVGFKKKKYRFLIYQKSYSTRIGPELYIFLIENNIHFVFRPVGPDTNTKKSIRINKSSKKKKSGRVKGLDESTFSSG